MSPLSFIGSHLLGLAAPVALFSSLIYGMGVLRARANWILAAQRATILTFLLLTGAVAVLIAAFLADDFSILYIYSFSSTTLPFFYKVTGLWAGLDGSILFWTWLVGFYAIVVLVQNRRENADWMPVINAVMMVVILFFLSLMLFANNPFTPMAQDVTEGKGLNPLLQNIAMVVHPPALYLGFTGFTVPFAFAVAALVTKRLDSAWIEDTRRWTILAWFFLTLGLILGGAWAYVELGWGGFWAWDPVENAALMPWLVATAYLHSVIIQQRRGMLKGWNVSLVCLIFILTLFGTYLTRSGVVQSVHAFSESNLGPFFLSFLGIVTLFSFCLIVSRRRWLKSENILHSYLSKEAAFLLNNVVLLVGAFAIIWGTLFPTLSEWVTGGRVSVGSPYFNQTMAPVGLVLLFLMGLGPMVSWKKSRPRLLRTNLIGPLIFGVLAGVLSSVLGLSQWYAIGSASLIAFVLGTLYLEFYRGVRVVRHQKGGSMISSMVDLVTHSNRRYGGYIVHLGVLLIFMGIAGAVFKSQADFSLNPGESFPFHNYQFTYIEPLLEETTHQTSLVAKVRLIKGKEVVAELNPAKFFYHVSEQPSTEASIHQSILGDIYLIIGSMDTKTGRANFRVTINPLISFIWFGGFVILMGVVVILLPRALKRPMMVIAPVGILLVSSVLFAEAPRVRDGGADITTLTEGLLCQCGDCVRRSLLECNCSFAEKERQSIIGMLQGGMSEEEVIDAFVSRYGLSVLTTPPRRGFFSTAYWIPPVVLIVGLLAGGLVIGLWYRRAIKKGTRGEVTRAGGVSSDDPYALALSKELKE